MPGCSGRRPDTPLSPACRQGSMSRTDALLQRGRRRDELAFLPAALEVVDTPPSPIGRAIALAIVLVFCAATAWAWFGTVDIVAVAPGKIIPSDRIKLVQPQQA